MPLPVQSITDKIIAKLAANLAAAVVGFTPTVNVQANRRRPSSAAELPLITVRPLNEKVTGIGKGIRPSAVERHLYVAVVVRVTGLASDLDPYRSLVIQTVLADLTAGGNAFVVEECDHDWEADDASDFDYAQDVITFCVKYQTAHASPVTK